MHIFLTAFLNNSTTIVIDTPPLLILVFPNSWAIEPFPLFLLCVNHLAWPIQPVGVCSFWPITRALPGSDNSFSHPGFQPESPNRWRSLCMNHRYERGNSDESTASSASKTHLRIKFPRQIDEALQIKHE